METIWGFYFTRFSLSEVVRNILNVTNLLQIYAIRIFNRLETYSMSGLKK